MTRRMYPEIPPRVEYELTEKSRDVLPILDALRAYGIRWLRPAAGAMGRRVSGASGDSVGLTSLGRAKR